mmetsp:Transcript_23604/g.58520  ORF Transcript_23604/g.58520 Transcript_23604/m.58520 type:complete len:222 (-) Transcript_23604:1951-2616(-)
MRMRALASSDDMSALRARLSPSKARIWAAKDASRLVAAAARSSLSRLFLSRPNAASSDTTSSLWFFSISATLSSWICCSRPASPCQNASKFFSALASSTASRARTIPSALAASVVKCRYSWPRSAHNCATIASSSALRSATTVTSSAAVAFVCAARLASAALLAAARASPAVFLASARAAVCAAVAALMLDPYVVVSAAISLRSCASDLRLVSATAASCVL